MTLLLAAGLLMLSLMFVRPAPRTAWRTRLSLHSVMSAVCLLSHALASATLPPVIGALLLLAQTALVFQVLPAVATPTYARSHDAVWLLAGLLTIWFAVRLLYVPGPLSAEHALLTASLGILLTGLLGAAASPDRPSRIASLLLAGNSAILAACTLQGPRWGGLACVTLLQAWILTSMLLRPASTTP